jgi:hypothetical protein
MKAVGTKPVAGGVTKIVQPRRAGSGHHCDSVSALVAAVWSASQATSGWNGNYSDFDNGGMVRLASGVKGW